MLTEEVMTPRVIGIDEHGTAAEAASTMKEQDIGWLPVLSGDRPVGVVTDRDLVLRVMVQGLDPEKTAVREVMSKCAARLGTTATVEAAADLMKAQRVRRLLIIDQDGQLAGVLSLSDLATRADRCELVGKVLQTVCNIPATSVS